MRYADECEIDCPIRRTAGIIEGKWTTLIFRELLSGKKRYSELQRALNGISPKVLSVRLKFLAQEGMITKKIYATVPPTTEYQLTPLGKQFESVIGAMAVYGERLKARDDVQVKERMGV